MHYFLDFHSIWDYRSILVTGLFGTVRLTLIGTFFGVLIGCVGAVSRAWRLPLLRQFFTVYVELIRNTPFIVQLFFIYFGLPAAGVKIDEWNAGALAMVVNLGAYSTEIIRAGVLATPQGQIEAALSLAMSRSQIFIHIVLRPALQRVWPALSSQIVIVMLGSAVCSQISTQELTFGADFIESRTFRAFEVYAVATLLYLMLAILLRAVLNAIGRYAIVRRPPA